MKHETLATQQQIIDNRPYTAPDITVVRHGQSSTATTSWKTYYFAAKGLHIWPLIHKEAYGSGPACFRFWSACPTTLQEARQHIADCLNQGKRI